MSPLSITDATFSRVITVLDSTIASSSSVFAIHANSASETIFLTGKDIVAYLKNLETDGFKVQELDLAPLAADGAPQSSDAPAQDKEEKIVQIAIGVKKEVDFSSWYTNVGLIS